MGRIGGLRIADCGLRILDLRAGRGKRSPLWPVS